MSRTEIRRRNPGILHFFDDKRPQMLYNSNRRTDGKERNKRMKQFQFAYESDESLFRELEGINQWRKDNASHAVLFRIYSIETDAERIKHVCELLKQEMPEALYLGCSTNGNMLTGSLTAADTIITCTVFERETTRLELLQFPFTEENVSQVVRSLREYCDANPWVSCVEMHATMMGMSLKAFCDEMSALPENIQVFGGAACNANPYNTNTYAFSSAGDFSYHSIVFLLLGGSDFHIDSTFISGWKPLRRKFKVTRASGQLLFELDGEPAYDIYRRFLSIENDENFLTCTAEFPLMKDDDGIEILGSLLGVMENNAILMGNDIQEGADIRLAYGDPNTIFGSILRDGQRIADFLPDTIQLFSCAGRRLFWTDQNVSDETALFQHVAPTSGFFSGSEFLRIGGKLHSFNMTLVFAAMREGEPGDAEAARAFSAGADTNNESMSLIRRFVSFIEASTAEFEELNRKLATLAITDGLTGLYNRTETERRIRAAIADRARESDPADLSLIMLDIDDFKQINDIYGHPEGDRVIIALADTLRKVIRDTDSCTLGRWGGEEFMVLMPGVKMKKAVELAQELCRAFAAVSYPNAGPQTVSIGVIQARGVEDASAFCNRVDKALYMAKANGKNQVIQMD